MPITKEAGDSQVMLLGHELGEICIKCGFSRNYILNNNLKCCPCSLVKLANEYSREKVEAEPKPADDKIVYICPNCKRERFTIIIDTLQKAGIAVGTGLVVIECECGLKTAFDWNNVK